MPRRTFLREGSSWLLFRSKKKGERNLKDREIRREKLIHYGMSFVGGVFGIYALSTRAGLFGQAQTANLIHMVQDLFGRSIGDGMLRLMALFLFLSAVILATVWEKKGIPYMKQTALLLDMAAAVLTSFLPAHMNPVLALYPFFFVTAFQWCAFKGVEPYQSATIFSTNNLKQWISSLTHMFMTDKDSEERKTHAAKAGFFGGSLLGFYTGVVTGYAVWLVFGIRSILFLLLPLSILFVLQTVPETISEIEEEVVEAEAECAERMEVKCMEAELG